MAVAALESLGLIFSFGEGVRSVVSDRAFVILLGFSSAIIDNVPLVAATMAMFDLELDNSIWHFIAYTSGTGGSMLILGSAAGIIAMGMEKINFIWYLKNISILSFVGYLSGIVTYLYL